MSIWKILNPICLSLKSLQFDLQSQFNRWSFLKLKNRVRSTWKNIQNIGSYAISQYDQMDYQEFKGGIKGIKNSTDFCLTIPFMGGGSPISNLFAHWNLPDNVLPSNFPIEISSKFCGILREILVEISAAYGMRSFYYFLQPYWTGRSRVYSDIV